MPVYLIDKDTVWKIVKYLKSPYSVKCGPVIQLLDSVDEMKVEDIQKRLKITQPEASNALASLFSVGMVQYRPDGKYRYYSINRHGIRKFNRIVKYIKDEVQQSITETIGV